MSKVRRFYEVLSIVFWTLFVIGVVLNRINWMYVENYFKASVDGLTVDPLSVQIKFIENTPNEKGCCPPPLSPSEPVACISGTPASTPL